MKLTKAQRGAVLNDGHTALVACPGSGKTHALVAKLLRSVEPVRGTPRRIACITYTNAAVYEIEHRLRRYGASGDEDYCDVTTIHSFCLNNILRFFHWRTAPYRSGFRILPSDSEQYDAVARDVCNDHHLDGRAREQFELLNRAPDGAPIVATPLTAEAAKDFWTRLEFQGLVDFPSIIYWSYRIVADCPEVVRAIGCRFSWILVDEFQDTSALQVEILRLIASAGETRFFIVGDLCQSIFAFAGARPDLFDTFAGELSARRDWQLLKNFRSSAPIVACAERLLPRCPPMVACGPNAAHVEEPCYVHAATKADAIFERFLPLLDDLHIPYGRAAILAPWWVTLLHLGRNLREHGVPIAGPGARPYKRTHLFALLAEQLCAHLGSPDPHRVPVIERELFDLVRIATGRADFTVFGYRGRRTVIQMLHACAQLRQECDQAVEWLRRASLACGDVLKQEGFLSQEGAALMSRSVGEMESDMASHGVELHTLTTEDIGIFASGDKNLHLLTLHKAKGREFDAVAVIDLHEGRVPHFTASTVEEVNEARRLLYVAITRAKRALLLVTDNESWRNTPSRFLGSQGLRLTPD